MPTSERTKSPVRNATDGDLYASFRRIVTTTYAQEYAGLAVLIVLYLLVRIFSEPFHQLFRLDDIRISFPHAEHEHVPVFWLFTYGGAVPALVLFVWAIIARPDVHKVHVTFLGLLISLLLTSFITDVAKDAIGRPRPDLIARCKPGKDAPLHELVTFEICTETSHHLLHDGWRSFPSGHSSFAFAGLGWLALVLASQLRVFRPRASLAAMMICVAPLLGAFLIAASRLEDYRHAVADVTAGSILGFVITYLTFRRYYPSLSSEDCSEPYVEGRSTFQRLRHEEEGFVREVDDDRSGR
ncbi:related to diacylglycerol pyrophosphate phosphatase [Ramularia collo-cygni]|uniref:Related to diacylglycerol pyrophosphate phosphatase n=1 Tax=Ramularia collo-cygni TaxID=112498 RepID=A0A2D3V716_9PEZI|nr:related to diacylglycerol pyrophosphate phosphatase [Ramularia collo-cygni]CZT17289.1 related to diacylglycerol pyrophosphate phosphatase [Ramularia collo-cygni]